MSGTAECTVYINAIRFDVQSIYRFFQHDCIVLKCLNYAALTKGCVIIGVSNRIEIWDETRWEDFSAEAEENFDEIAENMIDFGL